MRARLLHPSGRFTVTTAGTLVVLMLVSNIMSTVFWYHAGGVGLLDTDGGANLFSSGVRIQLPQSGTAERLIAIVNAYPPGAATLHIWLTCTLDLVFPPVVALLTWTAIRWSANIVNVRPWRTIMTAVGATLGVAYLVADWTENVLEILLLTGTSGAAAPKTTFTALKMGTGAVIIIAILVSVTVAVIGRRIRMGANQRSCAWFKRTQRQWFARAPTSESQTGPR